MVYIAFRRKTEENYASKQMQWVFLENKKKDGTSVRAFFVLELRVFSFQLDIRPAQCNLARGQGLIHTIIIYIIFGEEAEFVVVLVMQSDDQKRWSL